jgi:hypothetical protein
MFAIIGEQTIKPQTIFPEKPSGPFDNHVRWEWPQSLGSGSLFQVVDSTAVLVTQVPDGLLHDSSQDK